jgi:hypothetical protein
MKFLPVPFFPLPSPRHLSQSEEIFRSPSKKKKNEKMKKHKTSHFTPFENEPKLCIILI